MTLHFCVCWLCAQQPTLLCKSRFSRYFEKYFSETKKTFKAIAFYYDRPLVLIWTKNVYAKKVAFLLFHIILCKTLAVKEHIQIKFELTWTINRTVCRTQIWQHSMNGNQYGYAICHGILEDFVQLHINVVSIIWKTFTSRLSTDFVKFSISSAPILCADWRSYPTAQLIYGCTLLTTSVRLSFQQTPEIHYWIKVRWWWRPCHQFFALESNFCQVFNSGTSSMRWCVVLH